MSDKGLLRTGIVGAVIAAICCFTPVLVLSLGVIGVTWLAWYEYLLWAAFVLFAALSIFGLVRINRNRCSP